MKRKIELTSEPSPTDVVHQLVKEALVDWFYQHLQEYLQYIDDGSGRENGGYEEQRRERTPLNCANNVTPHFHFYSLSVLDNDRRVLKIV
jgi:hypothetical protein